MVNLTIRLNAKGSGGETSTPGKPAVEAPDTPKLICGGHLIQSELPTASGVGLVSDLAAATVPPSGYLGYKVRRTAGDKVHFCVRCHFPIAIYGRLDPCEHVFCLICAKKDVSCYLCDERVLRIQKLEVLEGIFVCGAAGCLRSFLSKQEFEWHIREVHSHLLPSRASAPNKLPVVEATGPNQQNENAPTPSPSQSQPNSPSHSKLLEPPTLGSNSNLSVPEASPLSEKQGKHQLNGSGPSLDLSEPPTKRKKLELQLNSGGREQREKEREREKVKERGDNVKHEADKEREDGPRGKERERSQKEKETPQRKRDRSNQDRDRDRDREKDNDREHERVFQQQSHREQWEQQQHGHQQQQGPSPRYQLPPPPAPPVPPTPPPPSLQAAANQPDTVVQGPLAQQGVGPNSFPPPQGFPPYHAQQQHDNRNAPHFESQRQHVPFMDPRMTGPPDYQDNGFRPRHPQQEVERVRNLPPQHLEVYRPPMDNRQAIMLPHYPGDYGGPMGMPMGPPVMQGMVRFQEGVHGGGHFPPKRGNFGPPGENPMGHPPHAFGWAGPANFAAAHGHPPFMNWQPPQ
ncbi:hypothetical protein R1sor_023004 [Riccia sorocarpa]|uniref:RING-type E3 ubiquitin transferase n=1 Tax=Riccia sorocarpa TaxID=122646 RepID=A0ABD3GM81_9MARC